MRQLSIHAFVLSAMIFLPASSPARGADPYKNLAPHYRHWIEEEVPYIIETEERQEFLKLASDAERDNFIKVFWEARNPEPGLEANSYRDEHYRRLAYANEHFGDIAQQDGWRTDQGRIYITLGEPQQRMSYPESKNVRPLVIWFYQSRTPALPTHFYVVFYRRSAGEPYTLYSPYQDGPSRLVTGLEGLNDQKRNLAILKGSLGDEVARIALSLIPGEPMDLNDYSPSLQSDVLLATIKGLPDHPLNRQMLELRRARERVISKIFTGANAATLEPVVFRDAAGRMTVHVLMALDRPEHDIVGLLPNKQTGYSLTLETLVMTDDGRPVYEQSDTLTGAVNESQAEAARSKRFAAECRLPLAPGKYRIVSTLSNNLNNIAVRRQAEVTVPAQTDWGVSKVLAFTPQPPAQDPEGALPFSVSGLRFVPEGVGQAVLHPGEPLRVLFQVWSRPMDPASREGHKVKVHYVYGSMMAGSPPRQEDEEIDATTFDASGTLLTGRTLSTEGMAEGNYRLVITVSDDSGRKAYTNLSFRIVPADEVTAMWTAYAAATGARGSAINDYKRGLSAAMQADNAGAVSWFRNSLADDPQYVPALEKLVDMLSESGESKQIAELSDKYPVTHEVSEQTAILISQADAQVGNFAAAEKILESEIEFQPPSAELYLALADVYAKQGNSAKAQDYKQRAARLAN